MGNRAITHDAAVIDLRSDTVTLPTVAMRAAMGRAQVGDDVYGKIQPSGGSRNDRPSCSAPKTLSS